LVNLKVEIENAYENYTQDLEKVFEKDEEETKQ
jgi:hypothetical protein